jgi:urease accessory protein
MMWPGSCPAFCFLRCRDRAFIVGAAAAKLSRDPSGQKRRDMSVLPTARSLIFAPPAAGFCDTVTLTPRDRTVRVREFQTDAGLRFVAEFTERTRLDTALGFALDDGRCLQIQFVPAELIEVRGDLTRIAWHIGALMMPCQIEGDRLLTVHNDDLETYLRDMGAEVTRRREPFFPEILNDRVATPKPGHRHPAERQIATAEPPTPDGTDGPF